MNKLHCPYCEIKKDAKIKTRYEALGLTKGQCECGALIDKGQSMVDVNGYFDIYCGCLQLLDKMAEEFKDILNYCDINLSDYFDGEAQISFCSSEIIEKLFVPYYGGTTINNFKNAIGINNSEHTWNLISEDEEEDE